MAKGKRVDVLIDREVGRVGGRGPVQRRRVLVAAADAQAATLDDSAAEALAVEHHLECVPAAGGPQDNWLEIDGHGAASDAVADGHRHSLLATLDGTPFRLGPPTTCSPRKTLVERRRHGPRCLVAVGRLRGPWSQHWDGRPHRTQIWGQPVVVASRIRTPEPLRDPGFAVCRPAANQGTAVATGSFVCRVEPPRGRRSAEVPPHTAKASRRVRDYHAPASVDAPPDRRPLLR
jgi:hypothetical protein